MAPPSDHLLTQDMLDTSEPRFPLEVGFCEPCSLVQLLGTVDPSLLFGEQYQYFSSFSDTLLDHSRDHAIFLIDHLGLNSSSLVVEIASNDGYMLRNFCERGIPVLGIDPAPAPARAARESGVTTLCEFFGLELARRLVKEGRHADLIIANNVVAHVADTNGLVAGLRELLKPDGALTVEFPYVRDLIEHTEFDTIYHEHLCYFSLSSAQTLFRRHGLFINDVRRLPIHGGSIRLFIEPTNRPGARVVELLDEERRLGLDRRDYYQGFGLRVLKLRDKLKALLHGLREQGHRICAYGAAAKGTMLLNFLGVDASVIEYCVDRNIHKQGRYIPGARIPIKAPESLLEDMPSHVLILPWNFKEEILAQQAEYRARGGRFIVPIPDPTVV